MYSSVGDHSIEKHLCTTGNFINRLKKIIIFVFMHTESAALLTLLCIALVYVQNKTNWLWKPSIVVKIIKIL